MVKIISKGHICSIINNFEWRFGSQYHQSSCFPDEFWQVLSHSVFTGITLLTDNVSSIRLTRLINTVFLGYLTTSSPRGIRDILSLFWGYFGANWDQNHYLWCSRQINLKNYVTLTILSMSSFMRKMR